MRIAILHDYLNQYGGAERVLEAFLEIFPGADLYTLLYDEKRMQGRFKKNIKKTSFLDISFVRNHHRAFIPLMPLASRLLANNTSYDLVLSSSAGYAKGFNIRGKAHVSYCHTPLRYAWEGGYLERLPGILRIAKIIGAPARWYLRAWDRSASKRVDVFIANSEFIQEKISAYYGREAEVVYPPVDAENFFYEEKPREDYYLMAGRLIYYKRFDLGIRAIQALGKKLKIAGTGPEEKELKKIAKETLRRGSGSIEFLGRVSDEEMRSLYGRAGALIFPQVEDFGLVAAEAQACGLPVIAYDAGGAKEIVEHGKTGILFQEQSAEGLQKAILEFEETGFGRADIVKSAGRFSKSIFQDRIKRICAKFLSKT